MINFNNVILRTQGSEGKSKVDYTPGEVLGGLYLLTASVNNGKPLTTKQLAKLSEASDSVPTRTEAGLNVKFKPNKLKNVERSVYKHFVEGMTAQQFFTAVAASMDVAPADIQSTIAEYVSDLGLGGQSDEEDVEEAS